MSNRTQVPASALIQAVVLPTCRNWGLILRLSCGCTAIAMLSACSSSGRPALDTQSTNYYVDHAAGNYRPPGPPSDPWGPYIEIAAQRFDVPSRWIRKVMQAESGGHQYIGGQLTVSNAGALGLMQLEPETYQEMAARYGLGPDPFNPYDNIMAGTAYIHEMYEVYGSPGFLAAYDAGPGRLDSYINGGRSLPRETTNYVAMIAPAIQGYYPNHRSGADQLALNTLPAGVSTGILPANFVPEAPDPQRPDQPSAPQEQMAALAPETATPTIRDIPESTVIRAVPPPQPKPSFSIIPAAMADTPPPEAASPAIQPGHLGWAIQVGAYNTASNANAAIGLAELSAVQMLMNGHPVIVSYHIAGHTKFRARVVGLPHSDAVNACARLSAGPTGCVVLSPEAQS